MSNHIAAIHVLKGQLQLSDDDYRALLRHLTGQTSSKALSDAQRAQVREHMQALAVRSGVAPAARRASFAAKKAAASPRERKVWALWGELRRCGLLQHADARALDAFVYRQVGVSSLRFCTPAQLDTLIESLKLWAKRGVEHRA